METIEKTKGSYTYFTDEGMEFTLEIPLYWEQIYKGKPRERLYEEIVQMLNLVKKVDKSRFIVDVGCNHGLFSVPVSLLGYKPLAFEPVKANYDSSFNNFQINNCRTWGLWNYALSNKNEKAIIYVPECPDNASLNKEAAVANMIRKGFYEEEVTCIRFDDWIKKNPEYSDIGLIKSDTQGNDMAVIEGMSDTLTNVVNCYLICEFEPHLGKMGHSYTELDALIKSFGFKFIIRYGNDWIYKKD